ncbi:MAG: hypothetical protein GY943_24080, partial [Chloroflexi bacterium]|nr:hypothetical protein [Chloroflexota bacterium]
DRTDYVPLVATNGRPAILTFAQGDGTVMLSGLRRPFTNIGLQEEASPQLVLNLLNRLGKIETVWFDEWHHGIRPLDASAEINNSNWLQRTPAGWAIQYTILIIFVALLLRGRRFGRPVPLSQEINRRAPLEYITAIANLSRRAGHKTAVLRHNHDRLKKHLGHRYRLSPTMPDAEFIKQIAFYNPHIDIDELRTLLNQLSQKNVSENDMVRLAAETAKWLKT